MAKRYLVMLISLGLILSLCGIGVPAEPATEGSPVGAEEESPLGPEPPDVPTQSVGIEEIRITYEWTENTSLREILLFISKKAGVTIVPDISVDESVVIEQLLSVNNLPWRDVLTEAARLCQCLVEEVKPNYFRVEKQSLIEMEFIEDTPIETVINLIAKRAGVSVIIASDVRAMVKFTFKNVPWMDALKYICKTAGFVVVKEEHNVYRIIHPAALASQLETRIFQLKYLRPPSDYRAKIDVTTYAIGSPKKPDPAKEFTLLEIIQNMLTKGGMLKYDAQTNSIIVKDTKPVLDEIEKIIKQLDVEPLMIMFTVRFINTSNEDLLKFGIDYTTAGVTDGWEITSIPQSRSSGAAGTQTRLTKSPFGVGGELEDGVSAGSYISGNFAMGFLSTFDVRATLRLFSKDVQSKLEQRPFIMTLDGKEATIWVGEKIHYPVVKVTAATGSTSYEVSIVEASASPAQQGFQLLVIPHIVKGTNRIMLTIIPQNQVLTGSKTTPPEGFETFTITSGGLTNSIDLPRIQESTMVTHLIIEDGQTAVIGGLSTERTTRTVKKIPLLGDIPIIGQFLFRSTTNSVTRSHLLIYLTPKIIRRAAESREIRKEEIKAIEESR